VDDPVPDPISQLADALTYITEYGFGDSVDYDQIIEDAARSHLDALRDSDSDENPDDCTTHAHEETAASPEMARGSVTVPAMVEQYANRLLTLVDNDDAAMFYPAPGGPLVRMDGTCGRFTVVDDDGALLEIRITLVRFAL
jgi:hypothetical protein